MAAIKVPIVSSFNSKGVNSFSKAFKQVRTDVKNTEGAFGKLKVAGAGAMSALRANSVLLGAAIGGALVVGAKKAIDAASSLEESMNAVDVTFGEAAESIHGLGAESVEAFGLSERAFNDAAVQFSAFAKTVAGPGGDVAATMNDLMLRAVDFASVMDMEVSEAMAVFQSTLAGQTEPIRRYGKDVSAAAVELYALENGLVASKSEMTEAIKVQARYGLLMEQTNDVAGDFANTSDSLANQQRILSAQVENLSAQVGKHLVPALAEATGNLTDMLEVASDLGLIDLGFKFQEVTSWTGQFSKILGVARGESDLFGQRINHTTQEVVDFIKAAKGAGVGTDDLNAALEGGIETIGQYAASQRYAQQATTATTLAVKRDQVAQEADKEAIEAAEAALEAKTDALEENRRATDDAANATIAAASADLGYRNSLANTSDAVAAMTETLDDNEASTQDQEQAVRDAESAIMAQAAAAVKLAEETAKASGETLTAEESARLYQQELVSMSGYLSGDLAVQIQAHIDRLGNIPRSISTQLSINTVGNTGATTGLSGHRAAGGPVSAGGTYLVGEKGPELLSLGSKSGQVTNARDTSKALAGGSVTVNVSGVVDEQMALQIAYEIDRVNGMFR